MCFVNAIPKDLLEQTWTDGVRALRGHGTELSERLRDGTLTVVDA